MLSCKHLRATILPLSLAFIAGGLGGGIWYEGFEAILDTRPIREALSHTGVQWLVVHRRILSDQVPVWLAGVLLGVMVALLVPRQRVRTRIATWFGIVTIAVIFEEWCQWLLGEPMTAYLAMKLSVSAVPFFLTAWLVSRFRHNASRVNCCWGSDADSTREDRHLSAADTAATERQQMRPWVALGMAFMGGGIWGSCWCLACGGILDLLGWDHAARQAMLSTNIQWMVDHWWVLRHVGPEWITGVVLGAVVGVLVPLWWLRCGIAAGLGLVTFSAMSNGNWTDVHLMARFLMYDSIPVPFVLLTAWCAVRLRPKAIPPGHCKSCGYNLTGTNGRICPECGVPVGAPPSTEPVQL